MPGGVKRGIETSTIESTPLPLWIPAFVGMTVMRRSGAGLVGVLIAQRCVAFGVDFVDNGASELNR